jgi:hypothetical protein
MLPRSSNTTVAVVHLLDKKHHRASELHELHAAPISSLPNHRATSPQIFTTALQPVQRYVEEVKLSKKTFVISIDAHGDVAITFYVEKNGPT